MATTDQVLACAAGQIGYSRWDDPQPGSKYGRWYAQSHGAYYGTSGVPFCAMFVSWVLAQVGARVPGLPAAYCPYILRDMRAAGLEVPKKSARPGDIVLFDWDGGVVDHVGFAEANRGGYLQTIEGNTSNGRVARRTRGWGTIAAVFRPDYGGAAAPAAPGQGAGNEPLDFKERNMEFAYTSDDGKGIKYCDGTYVRTLAHPDELKAIQTCYKACYGRDLPIVNLHNSKTAPWGTRLEAAINRRK